MLVTLEPVVIAPATACTSGTTIPITPGGLNRLVASHASPSLAYEAKVAFDMLADRRTLQPLGNA